MTTVVKNSNKVFKEKKIKGLTAVLSEKGVEIHWDENCTDLHSKRIIGTISRDKNGFTERVVKLPWDLLSFGFTEQELNSCGWATAVALKTPISEGEGYDY